MNQAATDSIETEVIEYELLAHVQPLFDCRSPLLVGVRHHSAAMARAMPGILDRFQPDYLLVELPADFIGWIEHLADSDTVAPIAISAVDQAGNLAFYPMADFSPELVAIRWAVAHGVQVVPCDLSVSARGTDTTDDRWSNLFSSLEKKSEMGSIGLLEALLQKTASEDSGQLWERLVESPAIMADPDLVRQVSLLFGWAVRSSTTPIANRDLLREAAMRECLRKSTGRAVAVVGSFHASALVPEIVERNRKWDAEILSMLKNDLDSVGVSLIPYSFEQLDERSGYPAGIRDPVWHQRIVSAHSKQDIDAIALDVVVDICRALRKRGHVAGTPDATEVIRMMRDLAGLRGFPAAGRGELIESIRCCLVQGELHGRAREVAKAIESVLIGTQLGRVTAKTPRCGLAVSIEQLLQGLGLPTDESLRFEPKELRLDVLRNARDRARSVVLRQLCTANIPYAKRTDTVEVGKRENLIECWEVGFKQGTTATIASVARFGVTLPQVVEGILQLTANGQSTDEKPPAAFLQQLHMAAECGLQRRVRHFLDQIEVSFLATAGLVELVSAATLLGRIAIGHVPGLPQNDRDAYLPILRCFSYNKLRPCLASLLRTSLDRLSGLEGSDEPLDVVGICELMHWFNGNLNSTTCDTDIDLELKGLMGSGLQQLVGWCQRTVSRGSDRMRGAAAALLCQLGNQSPEELAALMSSWFDNALDAESRRRLRGALAGAVQVLLSEMQSDPVWLAGIEERLNRTSDTIFLQRLPALRGAFAEFSPADRERLLQLRLEEYTERGSVMSSVNVDDAEFGSAANLGDRTERLAALREADLEGRAALLRWLPTFSLDGSSQNTSSEIAETECKVIKAAQHEITMADRWRMMLGIPPQKASFGASASRSLDRLYGHGRGEGAQGKLSKGRSGSGGGSEAPEPTTAEWADDLEALFGSDVCQEVIGESAKAGDLAAVEQLDPDLVVASVQLLQHVLSLAGGLPEGRAERLRRIAKRITEQLAMKLAIRLRPALSGLSTPRPTRRRNRRLNLPRTIRSNLVNATRSDNGRISIIAKNLIFNAMCKREMDWHLIFVVDVSGSMTESVVYSALCAAIFAELPALSIRFLAFSTEVIDLSGHVSDPLTLLLEVHVGGGTHIGLGLRHARAGIKVPSRSMVVVVSDFEEGVSVGQMVSEIRTLVESGVRCIGLAALDDKGVARFHQGYATLAASAGMPVAAVSPEKLAEWVGDQIRMGSRH